MLMNEEQKDKYDFCQKELSALLKRALGERIKAEYFVREDGEERVELTRPDGTVIRSVNVSADSLTALARDVLYFAGR